MNKDNIGPLPSPLNYSVQSNPLPKMKLANQLKGIIRTLAQNKSYHPDTLKLLKHQLSDINTQIQDLEKDLDQLTIKMEKLRGEDASKHRTLLTGTLIKHFSQLYNREPLALERSNYEEILKIRDTLREIYSQRIKAIEEENKELKQQIAQLEIPDSLSSEDISLIFEFESKIREFFELSNFSGKDKYQALYDQKISPLLNLAKQLITQRPFHFSAKAAALKGKAAHAGLQAIKNLLGASVIEQNVNSKQAVFLLSNEGVVFKFSKPRSKEEERIIDSLFDLMSKQAVVGTFNIKRARAEKFGMQRSEEFEGRGYKPETLSSSLLKAIRNKLSYYDRLVLDEYQSSIHQINTDLANYHTMEKEKWFLKLPGDENGKLMTFKELQELYIADKLPTDAEVGSNLQTSILFSKHISDGSDLIKALNYLPTLQTSQSLYLSPDLSDSIQKNIYEFCERFKWSYINAEEQKQEVDFKTLQARFLQRELMKEITPISTTSEPLSLNWDYRGALEVRWKVISPELMRFVPSEPINNSIFRTKEKVSPLTNVEAKPFIADMFLLQDLKDDVLAKETIFKRLTPEAEFNAILTGELQLLDLHADNLGVAPVPNAEYEKFKEIKFYVPSFGAVINFKELSKFYLNGKILSTTVIEFTENGQTIKKELQHLPELQKALDVHWQLVIFDTDLSLSEDNRLQFQKQGRRVQHLIPLRSALLETSWKDQPLSNQTINQLIDSDERDLRVKAWIKKEDAPIYKIFSKNAKKEIEELLEPILKSYTLSKSRIIDYQVTIESLKVKFAEEISEIPNQLKLWQIIENELSSITIRQQDTFETIANRFHQDVEVLKQLNSTVDFRPGQKIKIKYDLTSMLSNTRRKKIAMQLFPRLTIRQQNALFERQNRRKEYLNSFKELSESGLQGDALINQIEQFINKPEIPLSSIRREDLLVLLQDQKSFDSLLIFKQNLCQECQPTYFNLMKAMYPLLADAYLLYENVYGRDQAGRCIGNFENPLENVIDQIINAFPGTRLSLFAEDFEMRMGAIKDPAFFGPWNAPIT